MGIIADSVKLESKDKAMAQRDKPFYLNNNWCKIKYKIQRSNTNNPTFLIKRINVKSSKIIMMITLIED
jgi:hypothetical protein